MSVKLNTVIEALERIAPPGLAEAWDNVGLLIEPSRARRAGRVLLTIDLTEPVLDEAIRRKAQLIVAYHPPIFEPIKRLTVSDYRQRFIIGAIENGLAVYSPHTALDAVPGGVNDWLCDGFGAGQRRPLQCAAAGSDTETHKIVIFVPADAADRVRDAVAECGAGVIGHYDHCSFNLAGFGTFRGDETTNPTVGRKGRVERAEEVRLEMVCSESHLPRIAEAIRRAHPYEEPAWEVYPLAPRPSHESGQGRELELDRPVALATLVRRIKRHLKLPRVRVAAALSHRRRGRDRTIALCAGAGGSVVSSSHADLFLTGEMRHHDILDANARGTSVVLCDHTNTERGYLPILRRMLMNQLGAAGKQVKIDVSKADAEPLSIV